MWKHMSDASKRKEKQKWAIQANLTQTSLPGLMIWKVVLRNVWSDIASWRTKPPSNSTKSQHHAVMTTNSKKKNWNPWENCQKYALKLSWNDCIWHTLVGTRHSVVSKQICTSSHQMDKSLWQTFGSFYFVNSSYKWIRTIVRLVVNPIRSNQNLRVFWKLVNPQECVWEIRYRIIMKTILQEKVRIHYSTTTWFTNLFLCFKLWRFWQRKQQWTRNGKNWRKFRRGTWRKSKVRNRWSMKQGRRAKKFTSPH